MDTTPSGTGQGTTRLSYAGVRALSPSERRAYLRNRRTRDPRRPDPLPPVAVRRRRALIAALPFGAAVGIAALSGAPDDDGGVLVGRLVLWIVALVGCVAGPPLLCRSVGSPMDIRPAVLSRPHLEEQARSLGTAVHIGLLAAVWLGILAVADHLSPGWQIDTIAWAVVAVGAAVSGTMLPSATAAWQWTDSAPPAP